MRIDIEEADKRGAFRAFDGDTALGSVAYVRAAPDVIYLQHTGVEAEAQGRGVGTALFEHVVAWARETGTRLVVQCPYLRKKFLKNPETRDVLR